MSPPLVVYSSVLFSSFSCCVTSSFTSLLAERHDWRRIMTRNNSNFNKNNNWWREGGVKCNSSGSRGGFGQSKKKKEKKKDPPNNINTNTNSAPGLSLSSPPGSDNSPNKLRTNTTTTTSSTDFQFEQRLQAIKRSALEQKKLDQQTAQYGAIDYDQPNTNNKDPPPKTMGLAAKIGIGVAVVIFGLVFALGDFLPTTPTGPSNEAVVVDSQLSEEEKRTLQDRLEQFEAALAATPKDPMAVEGAAVTLAELGEYSRAASFLEDLIKMKPNDPDAFRLLGEVQYQLKYYKDSAAAYKRSAMVSKTANFEVLRGLTNALLADKKPDEAVQVLLVFRERLNAEKMAQGSSSQNVESEVADPTVQVELLLGKAYSDWGHVSDAVSVYDQLISTHPDDFRGYLAKGIILKENGRAGDAERMFIQARFFAPEKAKALVDRYSKR